MDLSLGQSVLNCKATLSGDIQKNTGHLVPMLDVTGKTAYELAYIGRTQYARRQSGLTQGQMAKLLGLEQGTYKQYETRSKLPHYLQERFCLASRIDLATLVEGKGWEHIKGPVRKPRRKRRTKKPAA